MSIATPSEFANEQFFLRGKVFLNQMIFVTEFLISDIFTQGNPLN